MARFVWTLGALSFAFMLRAGASRTVAPATAPARPRSLLLIVVDTLRYDGGQPDRNAVASIPRALRHSGRHFTRAMAASTWTRPSLAAIMTGCYPSRSDGLMGPSLPLAVRLSMAGFRTRAIVSNPSIWLEDGANADLGFEQFDRRTTDAEPDRHLFYRNATATTDAALVALSELSRQPAPWFLWVHYFEPHGPYRSPERFLQAPRDGGAPLPVSSVDRPSRGSLPAYQVNASCRGRDDYRARYQAAARYSGEEADRLLRRAASMNALRDTLIVFTADHGEFLGEDDYWFQHQIRVDPALVHVPLVMSRGNTDAFCTDLSPVSHTDILPTALPWLTGEHPAETDGVDLFSGTPRTSRPLISEYLLLPRVMEMGTFVDGAFVVRSSVEPTVAFRFDGTFWRRAAASPGEDRTAGDLLRRHASETLRMPANSRRFSPEDIQRLRALGYLGSP